MSWCCFSYSYSQSFRFRVFDFVPFISEKKVYTDAEIAGITIGALLAAALVVAGAVGLAKLCKGARGPKVTNNIHTNMK